VQCLASTFSDSSTRLRCSAEDRRATVLNELTRKSQSATRLDCRFRQITVPFSRVAEFIDRSDVFVRDSGLLAPVVAHIGDGNIYRAILFKGSEAKSTGPPHEVEELAKKLALLAIELEGTSSGEHGIGLTKRGYLKRELGEGTLRVMRRIKREMDPLNLLNPGKILFDEGEQEQWK
jgi:D-lactate dehydrogenase (cytochrome)